MRARLIKVVSSTPSFSVWTLVLSGDKSMALDEKIPNRFRIDSKKISIAAKSEETPHLSGAS